MPCGIPGSGQPAGASSQTVYLWGSVAGPAEIGPLRGLTGPHQSSRGQNILSLGCSPLSTFPAPARPFPLGPTLKILLMVEAQLRLPNRNRWNAHKQPCALLGKTARSLKQLLKQSEVLTPISQVTKLRPRVYPDAQGHLTEVGFEPRTVHITLFPVLGVSGWQGSHQPGWGCQRGVSTSPHPGPLNTNALPQPRALRRSRSATRSGPWATRQALDV